MLFVHSKAKDYFMAMSLITIYTDGSCHTQLKIGAWAAVILVDGKKKILTGKAENTTHNRMELTAVIDALMFVQNNYGVTREIKIISDSQYVIGLTAREQKLSANDFITKKGKPVQNADLVKQLLFLLNTMNVNLEKIKAHQQKTGVDDYNIEVDKLSRKLVREGS